ncbi:PREDICTED: GATA zinc finger domain-containing protein 14-like [Wasmannia auropunctata]|uniref:GATA zinc finger domain-containing protein 14-like n=1 Tax=Wasmannia auropunctata TaxID=64793 RepID=UPI0005EF49B1|nr:PREDICTED: GATA zinc finger domain-containing protein 14-like [Wasmannia auropunctata]
MDRKMKVFSRHLRDVRREIRKEMEDLKDEIMFREEDWKRERNELKERIEKLETRRVEYNENGQNNTRQLEQENNTRNSSSLITSTSSTFRSQGARPASGNYEGTSRCNSDGIANNWSAGTSGTPARNAQSQNSNVAKPNGSNRPNVASTVSDTRENNSFRIKSDDANRSTNKSNQSAPGNSRNANNTTNTDDDSAKIMCHCRKPAIQLIKKDELCKERRYYKCANSNKSQEIRCDFVLWASDSANQSQSNATDEYSSSTSKDINKLVKKLNQSAPGNSRNANNTTNTDDDSAKIIMCHCRKPAIKLAKKEGSYKGRLYYKCANKLFGSRCNFFLSASDSTKSRDNVANDYSSSVFNMDKSCKSAGTSNNKLRNLFTSNVMCNCNRPALKLKSQTDPDKRSCYLCPNSICHFVKWENIDSRKNTNRSNYNSRALKIPKTESKRRCGICRREGHTRINCPARR